MMREKNNFAKILVFDFCAQYFLLGGVTQGGRSSPGAASTAAKTNRSYCNEDMVQLFSDRSKNLSCFPCLAGFLVLCLSIHFLELLVLSTSCTDSLNVGMGICFLFGGGGRAGGG